MVVDLDPETAGQDPKVLKEIVAGCHGRDGCHGQWERSISAFSAFSWIVK
jgi:hypothetical protein